MREPFAICFESRVAVNPGCHVSEVRGREGLARGGFELKNIQRIGGTLDNVVGGLQERISERKQSGEQRATGEELQERPAIGHEVLRSGLVHFGFGRVDANLFLNLEF
jgi:hypothetical protein